MNLPLHYGVLGALEAGLIALLVGMLCFLFWNWLSGRMRWSMGHAIGWACVSAVVIGAGIDVWNMFYLGIARLESPLYARIALKGIHDPDGLGSRVVLEIAGALTGVVLGWQWFSKKIDQPTATNGNEKTDA
ncbi:hypothetical protein J2X02_001001 [Pseudoxanthomonas japonensis]|uniref:hypothetical protein n=1 Tax=Pseudoxanthomonas TaxID=83618 RepID=UPI00078444D5|nr:MULTISPECIES: hypothetical protein [Pseudoxanthomonas]MBA3928160.1 hypothetical protein [Xanthomonas sp.]MBL8256328.1 hypothetical protein [Pseudoxanthomonas mexicana]MDR7068184.1 hypothetical protein [Pseudoxanthomonas japonensis]